jgi:1,4-alpha-glucan branching enzyme
MPGDAWQQFANLRLLFAYQYAQSGKKLIFMGGEFGQGCEWNHDASLDWGLLDIDWHAGVQRFVTDLNRVYREEPSLHRLDTSPAGFEWVDCTDMQQSVISFLRKSGDDGPPVLAVFNFTPVPRAPYRLGVPCGGYWRELLNSDSGYYGGSGVGNLGGVPAEEIPAHNRTHSVVLALPPLGALYLKPETPA